MEEMLTADVTMAEMKTIALQISWLVAQFTDTMPDATRPSDIANAAMADDEECVSE